MYQNGNSQGAAGSSQQIMQQAAPAPNYIPPQGAMPMQAPESKFDGSVLECFCASLVVSLMIVFTLGIATPWAVAYMVKFILSHAIIDGRRYTFDGTGGQLFGNWIKWFLLTVITIGIYSFWVMPKMINWVVKHTHVAM